MTLAQVQLPITMVPGEGMKVKSTQRQAFHPTESMSLEDLMVHIKDWVSSVLEVSETAVFEEEEAIIVEDLFQTIFLEIRGNLRPGNSVFVNFNKKSDDISISSEENSLVTNFELWSFVYQARRVVNQQVLENHNGDARGIFSQESDSGWVDPFSVEVINLSEEPVNPEPRSIHLGNEESKA